MPFNSKKIVNNPDSHSNSNDTAATSVNFSQIDAANLVEGSLRSAALTLASRHPQTNVETNNNNRKRRNSRSVSQLSDSSNSDFSTLNSSPSSSSAFVSLVQQSEKTSGFCTPSNEKEESEPEGNGNNVDKRQKRLLRNRLAAQESRQKKKNYLTNLENKIKEFEDQNLVLFHHLVNLTEQLNSGSILDELVGSTSSQKLPPNSPDNQLPHPSQFIPSSSELPATNSRNGSLEVNLSSIKNESGALP